VPGSGTSCLENKLARMFSVILQDTTYSVEKNADEDQVECSSQKCYDLFSNWSSVNNNDYKCTKIQFCVRLKRLNLDGISIKKTKINSHTVFDMKKLKKLFGIGCLLV
jgi:hypothetical protein